MSNRAHNRGNPPFYVPTAMFADILAPLVEEMGEDVIHEHADGTVEQHREGGIEQISRRLPQIAEGIAENSVPRRLWSILNKETMRTGTEMADSILLACGREIEREHEKGLPTFAAHISAAREMIDIHNESQDIPVLGAAQRKLERQLVSFCKAFCIGLSVDADDLVEMEATKTAVAFIREMSKEEGVGSHRKRRDQVTA